MKYKICKTLNKQEEILNLLTIKNKQTKTITNKRKKKEYNKRRQGNR